MRTRCLLPLQREAVSSLLNQRRSASVHDTFCCVLVVVELACCTEVCSLDTERAGSRAVLVVVVLVPIRRAGSAPPVLYVRVGVVVGGGVGLVGGLVGGGLTSWVLPNSREPMS